MAVESLRRRRFGTEGSSIYVLCRRAPPVGNRWDPHKVDGTSGKAVTRVAILNREVFATLRVTCDSSHCKQVFTCPNPSPSALSDGVAPAVSDTLSNR